MSEQDIDLKRIQSVVWLMCFVACTLDPKKESGAIKHAAENADTMSKEFFERFPKEIFFDAE